ncbi:hypothetical protein C8R44DRAFT_715657 [Mycena epipterygia]|nr:hypothetical protein C8R44DRAFT_715657 [Mycena epipterygia]
MDFASHAQGSLSQLRSRSDDTSLNAEVEKEVMGENVARCSSSVPEEGPRSPRSSGVPIHMTVPLPPSSSGENDDAGLPADPNTGNESIRIRPGPSVPRKRFGLNVEAQAARGAPRDYRMKYAEDQPHKELDPEARVWLVYNDESAIFDNDMIAEAGDNLDILLVFAGLFSAVLSTFVAQTSQALSPDTGAISNSILLELVALQRAQANGSSLNTIPAADTSFTAAQSDIWVNGLWFTSLALSLSTALLAVLAKQWLRQYSTFITGSPRTRAAIRQFRYAHFDKWGVRHIIGLLPTILHLSLFLFMTGLVVFLSALNRTLAYVVTAIGGFLLATYIITNLLPSAAIGCPYQTPLSAIIYRLYDPVIGLFIWTVVFIPMSPYITLRAAMRAVGLMEWEFDWMPSMRPMGTPFREAERAFVDGNENVWAHSALSWLVPTTSDPAAKVILVEALGATDIPLALGPFMPTLIQQRDTTASRLIGDEPCSLGEEMALGRLIRATMVQPDLVNNWAGDLVDTMMECLPTTPIAVTAPTTILAIAACHRTSRFTLGDRQEDALPPHAAFNFVLDHYPEFSELVAPVWMWWSICTQAAMGSGRTGSWGRDTRRLLRICRDKEDNIVHSNIMAWFHELSVPGDLRKHVENHPTDLRRYGLGIPISLAGFLAVEFRPKISGFSSLALPAPDWSSFRSRSITYFEESVASSSYPPPHRSRSTNV